ncbi:MAG: 30S ribosomal protein S3 [bacterium]|nr:30S ribosomal protein S3 [bacterium]
MGQKINPLSFRLGYIEPWRSRWMNRKHFRSLLRQDVQIRSYLDKKLKGAAVDVIEIERSPNAVSVIIKTARPGIVIGRGGGGIEDLQKQLQQMLGSKEAAQQIKVRVEEVKSAETSARIMAESIAEQLEKRLPHRRIMKQARDKMLANKIVEGAKIMLSGRIGGAEIARREWLAKGRLPLHTLRANIDFARAEAHTTYGVVGIKVWIYKGQVFEKDRK